MRAEPQFPEVPFPGDSVLHGDLYFSVFRVSAEEVFSKAALFHVVHIELPPGLQHI